MRQDFIDTFKDLRDLGICLDLAQYRFEGHLTVGRSFRFLDSIESISVRVGLEYLLGGECRILRSTTASAMLPPESRTSSRGD